MKLGTNDTPMPLTKDNIIDLIHKMGSVLDEQNVPDEDISWVFNFRYYLKMISSKEFHEMIDNNNGELMRKLSGHNDIGWNTRAIRRGYTNDIA